MQGGGHPDETVPGHPPGLVGLVGSGEEPACPAQIVGTRIREAPEGEWVHDGAGARPEELGVLETVSELAKCRRGVLHRLPGPVDALGDAYHSNLVGARRRADPAVHGARLTDPGGLGAQGCGGRTKGMSACPELGRGCPRTAIGLPPEPEPRTAEVGV